MFNNHLDFVKFSIYYFTLYPVLIAKPALNYISLCNL